MRLHLPQRPIPMPDAPHAASPAPLVGIAMGSESDWPVMQAAADLLAAFEVPFEVRVLIGGAGGAAHLPGMLASATTLPVIGVPVPTAHLGGLDSLLSIVQMPGGVPVATMAIGGAKNAGLLAAQILALSDPALAARLDASRVAMQTAVAEMDARVRERGV